MNYRLLCKVLGIVSMLIGATMLFSLPWAFPTWGHRHIDAPPGDRAVEVAGILGLLGGVVVSFIIGGALYAYGRLEKGHIYRKEAMAVVGLSWFMATFLGALPFVFCGVYRGPSVRIIEEMRIVEDEIDATAHVIIYDSSRKAYRPWKVADRLTADELHVIRALLATDAVGLSEVELDQQIDGGAAIARNLQKRPQWQSLLQLPGNKGPKDRINHFRIRWLRMSIIDALFESQSGFSTTGATVISKLEDPHLVPHCILFWRSSTHFLGGLGIIVLFVVVLGQGSAGKAMMQAEMPGPSKEGSQARMQHTAWIFTTIYVVLNGVLVLLLKLTGGEAMTWFDAFCHAFGTMATGGFSTYDTSLGHFNSAGIDYIVIVFMILAGTNFTLLYFLSFGRIKHLIHDVEWRTYIGILVGATCIVVLFGGLAVGSDLSSGGQLAEKVRIGLFQVVSIVTTTGYGTNDFDNWNSLGRGLLFLLMFVGGCAGSTGGGMKVIRHILFLKVLRLEVEQSFRPSVVRPLRVGGQPVDDPGLRKNILVYFGLILVLFVFSWMAIVAIEPDTTWGHDPAHKLIDSASGVAATLNNIGPGLGTVGATQNYGHFSPVTKLIFTWLMMLGRVEVFVILVLFTPSFWRTR